MSATTIKTDTQCKVRCGAPSSDGTLPLLLREGCLFILFLRTGFFLYAGPVVYGSATVGAGLATVGSGSLVTKNRLKGGELGRTESFRGQTESFSIRVAPFSIRAESFRSLFRIFST
jgi:hypothetical protein